jgi:hypothetical protein
MELYLPQAQPPKISTNSNTTINTRLPVFMIDEV